MKWIKYLTISMLVVATLGCAKEKKSNSSGTDTKPKTTEDTIIDGGPGAEDWDYGATAALKNVSTATFSKYLMKPVVSPKNIRINLDFTDLGNDNYGGSVKVSYTTEGDYAESEFIGGDDSTENKFNRWVTIAGDNIFHGFFQDEFGAIVIVLKADAGFGDGTSPTAKANGSIWFKNFKYYGPGTAPQGPSMCWFISLGPYDCRSFLVNDKISSASMVNPNAGYVKLGDFTDVKLSEAFNY
jgi:hypothetical protein